MEIITYKEDWKPSDIQCDWKPSKLGRYSFNPKLQLIRGITEGYKQNSSTPTQDSNYYLTDYIEVIPNGRYYIEKTVSSTLTKNILYLSYFDRDKQYLSTETFSEEWWDFIDISNSSACYVRVTFYNVTLGKIILYNKKNVDFDNKKTEVLNIVDNKENIQVYKNLNLEVFVKQEAIIKNFVNCFNLKAFQSYPIYDYSNFIFQCYDNDYYGKKYSFSKWTENTHYSVGDLVYDSYHTSYDKKQYLKCISSHTSSSSIDWTKWRFIDEFPKSEPTTGDKNFICVVDNINEDNYSNNSPYVANLIFKNLWGNDKLNTLATYVKGGNLAITYKPLFSKMLRIKQNKYNKFFDIGYFEDNDISYLQKEKIAIRFFCGDSFENDEILGKNKLNNYFSVEENIHNIPSNWDSQSDLENEYYFGKTLLNPFCSYYNFEANLGIPFFKNKVFNDAFIQMVLQREDVLGNIFKRIVKLPVSLTFNNNLIKIFAGRANNDLTEYLNSENIYETELHLPSGSSYFYNQFDIWCPNIKYLTISSTIRTGTANLGEAPKFFVFNNTTIDSSDPRYTGQLCTIRYKIIDVNGNTNIEATHILEYSDGENYDKVTFMEKTTVIINS